MSGVGKSTLGAKLANTLENTTHILADYYLEDKKPEEDWQNYLSNLPVDWELIKKQLSMPVGTKLHAPLYDFMEFKRIEDTSDLHHISSQNTVLDFLYPAPFADVVLVIDVPENERQTRVLKRNRDPEETPWFQYRDRINSTHREILQSHLKHHQKVKFIDNSKQTEDAIIEDIKNWLGI